MEQNIVLTHHVANHLDKVIEMVDYDHLYLLTDSNTLNFCLPILSESVRKRAQLIVIPAGESNKNLDTLTQIWSFLSNHGATRKSLLLNLGGGVVTDIGGFAAATFKRGIRYINLPTTLLSAVDAAVGGKTGINFNGLKNEVGAFYQPHSVILTGEFFPTLPRIELFSGYAEMIKHALISSDEALDQLLEFDLFNIDLERLTQMIGASVRIKERIVAADPLEKGIRKALNLGHTVGHAFESNALECNRPISHGYAVAYGLICELYLAHRQLNFPVNKLRTIALYIKENFGAYPLSCNDYDCLIELMNHDKKNESDEINFTLLSDVGEIQINQTASKQEIEAAFDFYRECCL